MKNILKLKKNTNEVNETENVEETKEENGMKMKWSLKKKLAIGGGLVALIVGGATALYNKGKQSTDEVNNEEDEDEEDFNDNEVNDNEVNDEVNIES